MFKRTASALVPFLLIGAFLIAGGGATGATAFATTPPVTFRLRVVGAVSPSMTFWIAYGPLGGHFAVLRLHRFRSGLYAVTVRLPLGRSSFAYIAGHGVTRDRSGPAPGAPVITIKRIDHSSARQVAQRTVLWHAPVG